MSLSCIAASLFLASITNMRCEDIIYIYMWTHVETAFHGYWYARRSVLLAADLR